MGIVRYREDDACEKAIQKMNDYVFVLFLFFISLWMDVNSLFVYTMLITIISIVCLYQRSLKWIA